MAPSLIADLPLYFSFPELLKFLIDRGLERLNTHKGSAFVFNPATRRLRLTAGIEETKKIDTFELRGGKGIAGKALDRLGSREHWIVDGSELNDLYKDYGEKPSSTREKLCAVMAVKIRLWGEVAVVFCFDFHTDCDRSCLADNRRDIALRFAKDLILDEVQDLLLRTWVKHTRDGIHAAGLMPNELIKRTSELIESIKRAVKKKGKPEPQALTVQLVDPRRNLIHCFQSTDFVLGFSSSASHTLDSQDIEAYIVHKMRPEIIVGSDTTRFDQYIFEEREHHDLTRLWIPLLPYHLQKITITPKKPLSDQIRERLHWKTYRREQELFCRHAVWNKLYAPPEGSAYGTFGVTYRSEDPSSLNQAPLTDELAYWYIQKVWELGEPLFHSTLPGIIETIGELSFALGATKKMKLFYRDHHYTEEKSRKFPVEGTWRFAIPNASHSRTLSLEELACLEFDKYTTFPKNLKEVEQIRSQTAEQAAESIKWASELYNHTMEAFHLHDTIRHGDLLGTEVTDDVIEGIVIDARQEMGAKRGCFYGFEVNRSYKDKWSVDSKNPPRPHETIEENEHEQAKSLVSQERMPPPYYESDSSDIQNDQRGYLPFDLADKTRGVLLIAFPPGKRISEEQKKQMEHRASQWIQRISMHRLNLAERFSEKMTILRQLVSEAKNSDSPEAFFDIVLNAVTDTLHARGSMVTMFSPAILWEGKHVPPQELTPSRLTRRLLWDVDDDRVLKDNQKIEWETAAYETVDVEIKGPCKMANDTKDVIVWRIDSDKQRIMNIADELGELESDRVQKAKFWLISLIEKSVLDQPEMTTMFTIPITIPLRDVGYKITLTVFLAGCHVRRHTFNQYLIELGSHIGEAIAHILQKRQQKYRKHLEEEVIQKCRQFAKEDDPDEIAKILMTYRTNDIGGHAVFWVVGQGNKELVARSASGKGVKIANSNPVRQRADHPWFRKNKTLLIEGDKNKWDRLNSPPLLWTFQLKDQREEYCKTVLEQTERKLMMTFPILDAQSRLFGLFDIFQEYLIPPEEYKAFEENTERLSVELCSAVEMARYRRIGRLELVLHKITADLLRAYRVGEVYRTVLDSLKKHFKCAHCDLFLHGTDNRAILTASTRWEETPATCFVLPGHNDPLSKAIAEQRTVLRRQQKKIGSSPNTLSNNLIDRLGDTVKNERLVAPILESAGDGNHRLIGLFQLTNIPVLEYTNTITKCSNCGLFSAEDIVEANMIARAIDPILRLVRVIEEHGIQVNALVHSIGQPLQNLRYDQNHLIRLAAKSVNIAVEEVKESKRNIDDDYDAVIDAKDRLGFLARLYRAEVSVNYEKCKLHREIISATQATKRRYTHVLFNFDEVDKIEKIPINRAWMRQAFVNLLDNAGKYSYNQRTVYVRLSEKKNGQIVIEVENLGIGIPSKDHERIFLPYCRSEVPDEKGKRQGTGLGLTLAKVAVEKIHGGHISVESNPVTKQRPDSNALESIANIPHKTTFTIRFLRSKLESLATDTIQEGKE